MNRIPYATLIATIMCLIGVGIFCLTMYRGASLTIIMLDQVFYFRMRWIEAVQIVFVVIAVSMAALGFMILFVGCLATGSTRHKVYRAWQSRVGGRISCAVVSVGASVDLEVWYFYILLSIVYGNHLSPELCMDSDAVLVGNRHIPQHNFLAFVHGG